METDTERPDRRRIQSIEVGFRIIRAMLQAERAMPLRDLAASADMAPSKAHLYLASFVREGMAQQDPETGHYGLGPFAMQIGLSAIQQLSIVEEARKFVSDLSDSTGCGAYLSLLSDRGPSIVSKSDGFRNGALSARLGYVLPTAGSATGHAFLAYLPKTQCASILDNQYARSKSERRPGNMTRTEVEKYLPTVRKQGYATTHGNLNANFIAIAAPVFDHTSGVAAVLTILGPDRYLNGAEQKTAAEAVVAAAKALSARMGAGQTT